MSDKAGAADGRTIDVSIDIDASVEDVWKALVDADELSRWFPLSARVTPGEGGEIWMSWGAPWEGGARIEAWEPNHRLRTRGFLEQGGAVVEYTLEARGGKTRLRLVHSGFERNTDWDDELFEGTRRGWNYELRSLRHYLERHRGETRVVAWPRVRVSQPAEAVWRRVLGPDGFAAEGSLEGLREGDGYRLRWPDGGGLQGLVLVNGAPHEFSGTVDGIRGGIMALRMQEVGGPEPGEHEAGLWLAGYGLPQGDLDALAARARSTLERLFPARA
jgi:uncharacterized protein YndB with AHSA1/START domain